MADQPATEAAQTANPPPAETQADPAAPSTAETQAPTQPSIEDVLGANKQPEPGVDPNQAYSYVDDRGQTQVVTLAQLVDAHKGKQTSQTTPELLEKAQLLDKVMTTNDPQAFNELAAKFNIGTGQGQADVAPAGVSTPQGTPQTAAATNEVAQLQQEINQLKQVVSGQVPLMSQLQKMKQVATARQLIDACKETLPFSSSFPQAADMVVDRIEQAKQLYAQQGVDLMSHPEHNKVSANIIRQVENQLSAIAKAFGGKVQADAAAAANGVPGTKVVDDQPNPNEPKSIPANYQVLPNGQIVDNRARPYTQNSSGQLQEVSSQPVDVSPGAGLVNQPPQQTKRVDPRGMRERIKARIDQLRAAQS
ncbi:MAG: hypothetical protein ACYSVY_12980 [Planctomycetota bacterium]|jgi:hypothetical protein